MVFWPTALFLSTASAAIIAFWLLRRSEISRKSADFDVALYRQQLRELDRDIGRGIVSPDEAEPSKLEISRRILEADKVARGESPPRRAPALATIACVFGVFALLVPGSLILYVGLGNPGMPDLPQVQRIENAKNYRLNRPSQDSFLSNLSPRPQAEEGLDPEYLMLVQRLRETVASRPEDVQGLSLLARHESAIGNFTAASDAMKQIVSLIGDSAGCSEHVDLAEFMILSAEGYVSPEAEASLELCLLSDADNARALYFMGLMHAQTGRPDLAFAIWRDLLERGRHEARWAQAIEFQIAQVAEMAGERIQLPRRSLPGPGAEEISAAAELDPEDRAAMIEGMVSGLESRLSDEGGSVDEWIRLIRSLGVLGQLERAEIARQAASNAFSDNQAMLDSIANAAREAGLP